MNCPNCDSNMNPVKTPSISPGYMLEFQQCPNCGGLWFNRFEVQLLPDDELKNLDPLDENILNKPAPLKTEMNCPKDNEPLTKIVDPNIPADSQIMRCHQCEGVWLNKGDLGKYEAHIKSKQIDEEKSDDKYIDLVSNDDRKRLVSEFSNKLMPLPGGLTYQFKDPQGAHPFILTNDGADLLREVPQEQKMEVFRHMAQEHDAEEKDQARFINNTLTIIQIIARLLIKV